MSAVDASVIEFFEQGGGLSDTLSHFELRPGQVRLVSAIESAIAAPTHLVAEAGTGIGKTFSYLLPTLLQHKKLFVSTATKHLQDQIFFKDLPLVEAVLGRRVSACLLKGRNNYFCHYRYELFLGSSLPLSKQQAKKAARIKSWSEKTTSGDLSEIAEFVESDMPLKKKITSTTENCLGGECPYFDDCFVQKVREKAKKSECVVVNHALLMADIVLKETGFAEILPEVDTVVIDEAHHLPKIATQAFAEQVSAANLLELGKDALQCYRQEVGELEGFEASVDVLFTAVADFREALCNEQSEGQIQLGQLKQMTKPYTAFKTLMSAYHQMLQGLSVLSQDIEAFEKLHERAEILAHRIKMIFAANASQSDRQTTDKNSEHSPHVEAEKTDSPQQLHSVALLEWTVDYFHASRLPIHLGFRFRDVMQRYADSWLFVSATLSVGESFSFFLNALGLPADIPTLKVDSPFDYPKNAAIHVMEGIAEPNHPTFVANFVDYAQPILQKTRGRAFMLFTSYRNLHEAADLMDGSEFTVFVQGDLPKSQLVDAFIQSDNAVLMGTVSFWEGVDVSGDKLSCVMIDKIPFPSPGDPIIAEQARYLEQNGYSAFAHCYIPKAATLLKQGAGRLIRRNTDTGVLVMGDVRMTRKSYGKQLLNAMPPATQVNKQGLFDFIDEKL